MEFVDIIVKKTCRGSEDGVLVKTYYAIPTPQRVEKKLAGVFVEQGWATVPVIGKPGPSEKKVVTPETKMVEPSTKAAFDTLAKN